MSKRRRLGELLIDAKVIDALQLQAALGHQRQWGMRLGRALVEKRFCTEHQILDALVQQTGVQKTDLDYRKLDKNLATLVPQKLAEQYHVVPLRVEGARGEVLVIACGGSPDLETIDAVRNVARKTRVVPLLVTDSDLDRAIDVLYRGLDVPQPKLDDMANLQTQVAGEMEFDLGGDDDGGALPLERNLAMPEDAAAQPPLELAQPRGTIPAKPPPEAASRLGDSEHAGPRPAATPPPIPHPPPRPSAPTPAPVPAPARPVVIIYGWPQQAADWIAAALKAAGYLTRIEPGPFHSAPQDVVLAPLPAIEQLVAANARPAGNIVVAVKSPESDLHRAQRVAARGYLATPLDNDLMLRAIARCMK